MAQSQCQPIFIPYNVFGQSSVDRKTHDSLELNLAQAHPSNIPVAYTPNYKKPMGSHYNVLGPINRGPGMCGGYSQPMYMPGFAGGVQQAPFFISEIPQPHTTTQPPQPQQPDLPQLDKTGINSIEKQTVEKFTAEQMRRVTKKKIDQRVYLALAAFCLNPLFGPVALLLAWTAQNKFNSGNYNEKEIDELLKASLGMSITGFITTILSLFLTLIGFLLSFGLDPTTFKFQ